MQKVKYALAAAATLGAVAFGSGAASAMPNGLPSSVLAPEVQNVRWVCGPYRCWWQPNYYRGWGWRRGWRRW